MQLKSCQRCQLHEHCKQPVSPRGTYRQPIVFVTDKPTQHDDDIGLTLIDENGMMLERVLSSVGCDSQDFYITSLVRCYSNKSLAKSDIYLCYRYLYRELMSKMPDYIVLLGNHATKLFLGNDKSVSKDNGQMFTAKLTSPSDIAKRTKAKRTTEQAFRFIVWHHPSTLLRQNSLDVGSPKWKAWQNAIALTSENAYYR